ncbi:MAG: sugar ABC transporter permease [Azospirillaceae bacterium]
MIKKLLDDLEVDTRLLGMVGALAVIWIAFHIWTDGLFITPRNLFNLSVQTASVAVMACGMVLVIVARHIDLSVGSLLGFLAMFMGVVQSDVLPQLIGGGDTPAFNHPAIWFLTLANGSAAGMAIGAFQGFVVGYLAVPAFIVTLGGLLVWRGCAWWITTGQTVAPLDSYFNWLGGGAEGSIYFWPSWIVAIIACLLVWYTVWRARQQRHRFDFPLKPRWAEFVTGGGLSALIVVFVLVMTAYEVPERAAARVYEARGWTIPEEGASLVFGIAIPVVILGIVALVMTIVARRTRFGRYVFAMGGNPDAAELAGINTRRMTVWIFAIMGLLCAISAAIASARLNSADNAVGTLDELRVIAAAVIGGSSLSGGRGTIYGAILGALVMQSLQSGMAMVGVDAPLQNIVIGVVLVIAVFVDQWYRRRTER